MNWAYVAHFRGQILLVVLAGIGASILEALGLSLFVPLLQDVSGSSSAPFPLSLVADRVAAMEMTTRVRWISGLLVVVYGVKGLLVYANGILSARLEADGTNHQIMRCYERLLGAKMSYVNAQYNSYLYSLLRQQVGRFGQILRAVAESAPAFFTFLLLLAVLVVVSWQMTVLAFGLAILASLLIQGLQRSALRSGRAITQSVSTLDATVLDTIHGLKAIHLFVRGADMTARFRRNIDDWAERLVGMARVQAASTPLFESISVIGLAVLLVVGSWLFARQGTGGVQFDVLVTFLLVFYRMMPAVSSLNRTRVSIASMVPPCEDVQAFLDAAEEHQAVGGDRVWTGLTESVEFEDVSFRYSADREPVLERVSIRIGKGTKVGIVGTSGAGKSTIGELLLHFYDPTAGRVVADGIDLRDVEFASWRRRIGVVTQETFLFNDTIEGNIRFSTPAATREQVEGAARRAHIHDFIAELPKGYATVVGDRGVLLSGGQRQRIAIARAILSDPEILLLDEATSALDSESEQVVQAALDEVSRGRTVVTIAHRLSTVSNSDHIIVLSGGRVVEEGTHQELMARVGGTYRRLAEMQSLSAMHESL